MSSSSQETKIAADFATKRLNTLKDAKVSYVYYNTDRTRESTEN